MIERLASDPVYRYCGDSVLKRPLSLLRFLVTGMLVALAWSACNSIDFATIDWDGDGVPDQKDAFPVDPNEDTDSDNDGVGDNSDAFPLDPTRSAPDPAGEPADNANDNAAPPDDGNANDNGSPDPLPPPSGGRR
jgi:hypothetical protein